MPIFFPSTSHQFPLMIDTIGNNWQQETIYRPNGHPYFHWLQTEQGIGEINIANETFLLKEGEGVLISPFTPHSYTPINLDWVTNFLTLKGPFQPIIYQMLSYQPYTFVKNQPAFSFQKKIMQMIARTQQPIVDSLSISSDAYQFILKIYEQQIPMTMDPLYKKYVEPSILYINDHISEELTVVKIAEQVFVSPQYLNRLFRLFLQTSTYQYILGARIQMAKELLINNPQTPVQKIAFQVGFDSASQFGMLFKERTGNTPKQFRNRAW